MKRSALKGSMGTHLCTKTCEGSRGWPSGSFNTEAKSGLCSSTIVRMGSMCGTYSVGTDRVLHRCVSLLCVVLVKAVPSSDVSYPSNPTMSTVLLIPGSTRCQHQCCPLTCIEDPLICARGRHLFHARHPQIMLL